MKFGGLSERGSRPDRCVQALKSSFENYELIFENFYFVLRGAWLNRNSNSQLSIHNSPIFLLDFMRGVIVREGPVQLGEVSRDAKVSEGRRCVQALKSSLENYEFIFENFYFVLRGGLAESK